MSEKQKTKMQGTYNAEQLINNEPKDVPTGKHGFEWNLAVKYPSHNDVSGLKGDDVHRTQLIFVFL